MAYGSIYPISDWGLGACNDFGWGIVYKQFVDCTPTPFFEIIAENDDFLLTESNNEFLITETQ
tara:strand:- start:199 stop:387 length:189 start_codon:yes stop_codon:yes gene_type:complete